MPISIDQAYAHCEALTRAHYENFPVGSFFIPKKLRPHVHSIYAFARTADDFADEPGLSQSERLHRLSEWEQALDTCLESPQGPIFTALSHTIHTQQIPIQWLKDLLWAFRYDVMTNRHQTFEDLLKYCTCSANPVGRLILHLFGYTDEPRAKWSDALCSALQLSNFWQDIGIDFSRNRIYLPQEDMKKFGVSETDLQAHPPTREFCALLEHQIALTRALFHQGYPLLNTIKGRLRLELRLTYLGGMDILRKIPQNKYDVFYNRPRIQTTDLPRLLFQTLFCLPAPVQNL